MNIINTLKYRFLGNDEHNRYIRVTIIALHTILFLFYAAIAVVFIGDDFYKFIRSEKNTLIYKAITGIGINLFANLIGLLLISSRLYEKFNSRYFIIAYELILLITLYFFIPDRFKSYYLIFFIILFLIYEQHLAKTHKRRAMEN